ncbi:hypothetical protein GRI40_10325 [Altererythrobacter aerius]|uniref:Ferrochelatase n=1 Tax=Tsuneonella aeria TaxID=1837929 RepID=A0A6I4TE72_9SPHN|nr:hypothetical protein [Tsuneonella aeria]MXO75611.1 hypothetical protein [Tsuneonella aeria]
MRLLKIVAAATALSMAGAPVLAQAQTANSAGVEDASAREGRTVLFVVLGLAAIILTIVGIGGDNDDPVSP